jgi:MscS family membrane protein
MMFEAILSKTYYGNTVAQWGVALLIVLGAVVVGKILYWICKNIISKLTSKTETKLDDIILDMIEEPVVLAVTIGGAWYGLNSLKLSEKADAWISSAFQALIVLSVAWLVARLLDSLFKHYLVPLADRSENDLDDQLLPILSKGTKVAVWSLGIIVALNNAGYNVGAILAGLGIGGLALAMAAKDTVANIFGGFTIFTDRPFVLNERVKVAGFDGMIKEIGVRSTRLQTLDGTIVTIPNSKFTDMPVENVSREPSRKVLLNLGLTYDTTPEGIEKAMTLLKEIASANDNLEEKVIVSFNQFGDFAMNLLFIYYIKKGADIPQTQTEMNLKILNAFNEAGLEFAFPTQTLYAKLEPPGIEAQAPSS